MDPTDRAIKGFYCTSEWTTILLLAKLRLILEVLRYLIKYAFLLWLYDRKLSNIRRAKCQNLNDSLLVLQLSVLNPLKPSVKSIMKM